MPSATLPTISADNIDDLLYLARINDTHDLKAGVEAIAQANQTATVNVLLAAVDTESGNALLHMACANNCQDTLRYLLLPTSGSSHETSQASSLNVNLPNAAGNTPLHWAAMNGHLEAVKQLVNSGADSSIKNNAGYDAVFEAERAGKEGVVEWLLAQSQPGSQAAEGEGIAKELEVEGQDARDGHTAGETVNGHGVENLPSASHTTSEYDVQDVGAETSGEDFASSKDRMQHGYQWNSIEQDG
ncbi:MAG: hypothetical protein Q9174_001225 [Haloplaca sp. 1 TL-2023]